ncbi:MAG: TIGR04283 family arsenosugar biosynthesis glycosyltransferase [Betaproteobacteria bacterium]
MRVSIVIPALDEAAGITATLWPLQPLRAAGHEVIVVDGGSRDATLRIAAPLADLAFTAPRGRALQMNAGAAAAHGELLLFLHADSVLASAALTRMLHDYQASGRYWGRFDVDIGGRPRLLRLIAFMMNARSRITGIATGDQAIFVTRELFQRVGGFPRQALMEDIALSIALKRHSGMPLCTRARVRTSGRRWERYGIVREVLHMWRLRWDYWRGVSPLALAARYPPHGDTPAPADAPVLQVFAKAPVPGRVKTRLARDIGVTAACALHLALVERMLAVGVAARDAGTIGGIELWCDPDAGDPAFARWARTFGATLHPQHGATLGERMQHALQHALARHQRALLVGTDCPVLGPAHLQAAADVLRDRDAVVVPAEDGGYVLIGLARPLDIFSDIAWSTADVMAATRARLATTGATWRELPSLWDIDRLEDFRRWQQLNPEPAVLL